MLITENLALDFGRSTLPITVFAKQYDKDTRAIEVTPYNNGQSYELEQDVTARLQLTKADGHTVINDCVIEDGVIKVTLTAQCLTAAGTATAEIALYKGEEVLSSQIFYIDVKKAAYDANSPTSSSEYNALVEALQGADNVNVEAEEIGDTVNITVTNRNGNTTAIQFVKPIAFDSWENIQTAVRMGLAPKYFPVGYEFTTEKDGKSIVWVVRGYDAIEPAKRGLNHSMILEAKYVYSGADGIYIPVQFDAPEALLYADGELEAGTYKFTVAGSFFATDNNKVFEFTLTQAIPDTGVIMLDNYTGGTLADKPIKTYANIADVAAGNAIETATIILSPEGSTAADLGTTDGLDLLNYLSRTQKGSNNYAQSALRQWLNSTAPAGSVWEPQTHFDAPPTWVNDLNGFMSLLPDDFTAVIANAKLTCRTNSVFERISLDETEFTTDSLYTLKDKMFVLSAVEIADNYSDEALKDGELLEYYEEATAEMTKKYDESGVARSAWLRTPSATNAYSERIVSGRGTISVNYAVNSNGVAPACIIA